MHNELSMEINVECKKKHEQLISDAFIANCHYEGNSLVNYSFNLFSALAKEKEICQGAFFLIMNEDGRQTLKFLTGYAIPNPDNIFDILEIGEGIPGQVARDGKLTNISDIPADCFEISSGLGHARPLSLIVFPVKYNNQVIAVIELSAFHRFDKDDEKFYEMISPMIASQIMRIKRLTN